MLESTKEPDKYRCPDGEEFETIRDAVRHLCVGRLCGDCVIYDAVIDDGSKTPCRDWAEQNPTEAARLLNIEIVGENVSVSEPPLSVSPYWAVAGDRIDELARAIHWYAHERDGYKTIKGWAAEIMEQCDLMHYMSIEYEEGDSNG